MARRESTPTTPGSRAVVVDLIRSSGPISRVELTAATGLTQPAISLIVRKLVSDGIVRETGLTESTGGKPRVLLEINPRALYGIGVQLGFESITFVATDVTGGVIGREQIDGAGLDEPEVVTARMLRGYRRFVRALNLSPESIAGVAVVAPGPFDQHDGVVLGPPTLRSWFDFRLRAALQAEIDVPVIVDNDAAAAAVGEFWSRRVSRSATFASIYMGSGIGSGIVIDGALYRGGGSNAGEIGHISIEHDGLACFCGNDGCLERYASPGAVVEAARTRPHDFAPLGLAFEPTSVMHDFDLLCRAAVLDFAPARALVEASAAQLASAAVTLSNLLDLDHIVLTGPAMAFAGSIYTRAMRDRLARSAFSRRAHPITVELSTNPRDAAAIGASALILQGSVAPGHGPRLRPPD